MSLAQWPRLLVKFRYEELRNIINTGDRDDRQGLDFFSFRTSLRCSFGLKQLKWSHILHTVKKHETVL